MRGAGFWFVVVDACRCRMVFEEGMVIADLLCVQSRHGGRERAMGLDGARSCRRAARSRPMLLVVTVHFMLLLACPVVK